MLVVALALAFCLQYVVSTRAQRAALDREVSISREKVLLLHEIDTLHQARAALEADFTRRSEALRQRESAIGGREDAATERTESSFQGLMIQQRLIKTLEALKDSLPDITPEVEKLTREHAQLAAENERLREEIARSRAGASPAAR